MTDALCLTCGNVKFGAIVPCPRCGVASTGDMTMDINFSDHYLARSTLEQLGEVVKTINTATEDRELRFYSFIYYVSENHPSILHYEPPSAEAQAIRSLLATIVLPPVELRSGRRGSRNETSPPAKEPMEEQKQPWWRFWKRGP